MAPLVSHETLELAQELAHPFSLAVALVYAAMFHQFRREAQATRERAETAIALCTTHGFTYYLAWATILRGWAVATQGQPEAGLAQMDQGLDALRATGGEVRLPYYLALLAPIYGRVTEGFETADLQEARTLLDALT